MTESAKSWDSQATSYYKPPKKGAQTLLKIRSEKKNSEIYWNALVLDVRKNQILGKVFKIEKSKTWKHFFSELSRLSGLDQAKIGLI